MNTAFTGPPIHRLDIRKAFEGLTAEEKLYAHHLSRAAWHGSRIVLRQTSPESVAIFDLILELHRHCSGDWTRLGNDCVVSSEDLTAFLHYAGEFLSNLGNYYGSGDQKFVPKCSSEIVAKLVAGSPAALQFFQEAMPGMFAVPPYSLGYPNENAQSMYYPGSEAISPAEVEAVSKCVEEQILPENTRLLKDRQGGKVVYNVLQGSVERDDVLREIAKTPSLCVIQLKRGDHASELKRINFELSKALEYAGHNADRRTALSKYIESFKTGDLEAYRDSQRAWIRDISPRIEHIFGFVEPYRDPHGTRAEFEGIVAISDLKETEVLANLVKHSSTFIRRLPWAENSVENGGKGPFERALFDPPDFTSIHALAYCSSIVFPGINLPNYNDIRQECGFKNVIIANRMNAESRNGISPFISKEEAEKFQQHKYPAYYLWVVLHELLGHGTSKLLAEESPGRYNFDVTNPPINPLTGRQVESWYLPGQSWTSQFGDLATTVDECRAELVGAYLIDDAELLALFGYTATSIITQEDITYNTYQQLGVDGLRGLQNFNIDDGKWGQAHSRAHFSILKWLLLDGDGFMQIEYSDANASLTVKVDRARMISHGKPALGRMLLRLHMYRCTADVKACRHFYEELSQVDGEYMRWRDIVLAQKQPKWKYVQANTFLHVGSGSVELKEYEATDIGIIESFVDRDL